MNIITNKKWAGALIVFILIASLGVVLVSAKTNHKITCALDNPNDSPIHITMIKKGGGRVSWSHSGNNLIAFDMKGPGRHFQVYTMKPDGSNEVCLTYNNPKLPKTHMGTPEWHPSGEYIVFTVEKENHPKIRDFLTRPGLSFYNDLWLMTSDGKDVWQLTDLSTTELTSVLHPHFSNDGTKLLWSETIDFPEMALKIADFVIDESGPHLENITMYQPGSITTLYESHGFAPDDKTILFTGYIEPGNHWTGMDIYTLNTETMELNRLTSTLDEWDEHAQYSPDGEKIVWISSKGYSFEPNKAADELRTELWMMNADGSNKTRLTYFNEPGYPEYNGRQTVAADSTWSPNGTEILLKIRLDHLLKQDEYLVMVEFDENKPHVLIEKPLLGFSYIFDGELRTIKSHKCKIFGKINVEVNAYDEDGIERVEFYIDDVLKSTDAEYPYEWLWNERTFGNHEIKVVAYDTAENTASDNITMWKFF